jgi:hypothetical protein
MPHIFHRPGADPAPVKIRREGPSDLYAFGFHLTDEIPDVHAGPEKHEISL